MKHAIMLTLALAVSFFQLLTASELPGKKATDSRTQVAVPAQPVQPGTTSENGNEKFCKVVGYRTIYEGPVNNYVVCAVISNETCVMIPCSSMGTGLATELGTVEVNPPGGVVVPEGQQFIGYYDANNVFQLFYVNSITYEYNAENHTLIIHSNPPIQ